jgi:hypothetical protein
MSKTLSPTEKIEALRIVTTFLNQLTSEGSLAGIILTDQAFDQFKAVLSAHAKPYFPAEISIDPGMQHTFVVDGLLVLRGTQLDD